jgi:hypothetical protein
MATIEVKSTLSTTTLKEVLDRHARTVELFRQAHIPTLPWHGGIFFSMPENWDTRKTAQAFEDATKDILKSNALRQAGSNSCRDNHLLPIPTCLVVFDKLFALFRQQTDPIALKISIFESKSLSFGLGAVDLLDHLFSITAQSPVPTALESSQADLFIDPPITINIPFAE